MDLALYHSPLIAPAFGVCIGVSIYLYKQYKHTGTLLILLGFIAVALSYLPIYFCTSIASIPEGTSEFPMLCNNVTPHIYGLGFMLIAVGISKLATSLKTNA